MARAGRFEEIHERFAPPLRPFVPAEALQAAWAAEISRASAVTGAGTPVSEQAGPGVTMVKIPVTTEHGAFTLLATVSDQGSAGRTPAGAGRCRAAHRTVAAAALRRPGDIGQEEEITVDPARSRCPAR